jgi:hypothetical protein
MATMRPTPRNELLGLLSDAMAGGLEYMRDPQRTQQLQGLAGLLESTGIPKTTERLAYGEDLTNIGRANVPLLKPETADALMTVAPFAPKGMKMIRATEGLPVGMGIKDVSPKIGINVNQGGSSFADKIISGEKKFETRESDSLRSYVGKRVGIVRTGEGKAKAIGDVTLGEPIVVSSPEEFAKLRDLHLVPEGSKFDIKEGGVKYLYPIENPVPYGVEKDVAKYGIVSRKILGEPDTLEKAIYPQQAALDLAQQKPGLLEMTRTPSETEIKKMSREDLLTWLQNNDPNGQYMDPTPNPSVSMYRTGKGYAVENADSGDVFEFKDFNEAQDEFNSMKFSNAEFQPMTLKEAQESAINYLRESAQPAESAKVLPFQRKGLLSP